METAKDERLHKRDAGKREGRCDNRLHNGSPKGTAPGTARQTQAHRFQGSFQSNGFARCLRLTGCPQRVLRSAENRCEAYLAPYSREFALFAVNLLFSPFTHCSRFLFITVFVVDAACSCSSAFAMDFLSSWPLYARRINKTLQKWNAPTVALPMR